MHASYNALVPSEGIVPIRPLLDWLSYNGFAVNPKRARERGTRRGSFAVDLIVDVLTYTPNVETIVLVTGDGQYRALIEERDAGDEEREKTIHKAWAVLTGKEDATLLDQPKEKVEGASGTARALCTHERGKPFVMDWKQVPRGAGEKRDLLIYSNPQTITWDGDVDGYVRVSVKGEKAPFDPASALRKASHDAMDGTQPGDANTATHSGKVDVEQAPCPICAAPRLMVCNTCLTIICHRFRNDYPAQGFNCPKCNAVYQWGTGGARGDVIIDGKQLRSLTKDERKEITEDMVKGRITYLGAKD